MTCRFEPVEIVPVLVDVFDHCDPQTFAPVYRQEVVTTLKGTESQVRLVASQLAELQAKQCSPMEAECVAAVPEWWQVRLGADRPQLVVLFAEEMPDGKLGRSRFAVSIPHYNKPAGFIPPIPRYKKGPWEGILTLSDNSKLIINAATQTEAYRVINALKPLIANEYLKGSFTKIGERRGQALKVRTVVPRTAKFFATGQKNMIPDFVLSFGS